MAEIPERVVEFAAKLEAIRGCEGPSLGFHSVSPEEDFHSRERS